MHVRKLRRSWFLDSTPWNSGFQYGIPHFFLLELGFRIPIVCGIADSLSWFPDSKTQNSVLHKRHFPDSGFRKQNFPAQHEVIRVVRIMLPK